MAHKKAVENHVSLMQPTALADQSWPADTVPAVSICCTAFNHEAFICETLEGFLMQKTTFPVEVLIHDDASSDGTAAIIQEYAARFPNIIKPILQVENQHSKGVAIDPVHNYPRAAGRYVAVCEGDDCWIDAAKLQRQFDLMEANPGVDICFHPCKVLFWNTNRTEIQSVYSGSVAVVSLKDVILGDGGFMPTASLLMTRSSVTSMPAWIYLSEFLDFYIQIYAALRGGALYTPEVMSLYRSGVPGSWTARMTDKSRYIRQNYSIAMHLRLVEEDMPFSARRHIRAMRRKYLLKLLDEDGCSALTKHSVQRELKGCLRTADVALQSLEHWRRRCRATLGRLARFVLRRHVV